MRKEEIAVRIRAFLSQYDVNAVRYSVEEIYTRDSDFKAKQDALADIIAELEDEYEALL